MAGKANVSPAEGGEVAGSPAGEGTVLPVSVLIPVRNCVADLPGHVEALSRWIDRVAEVLVVDSESSDGTPEFLRERLGHHPGFRLVDHPPGLYESWNFGISQATQKYLNFATVGDGFLAGQIDKIVATAERFAADVVVSAPTFVSDESTKGKAWPIHEFLEVKGYEEAQLLSASEMLCWAMMHLPGTLLGSSASNLYRSAFLQQHPFPLGYGHACDSAWAIENSFRARWVIDPTIESLFWIHESSPKIQEVYARIAPKLAALPEQTLEREGVVVADDPFLQRFLELYHRISELVTWRMEETARYREKRAASLRWSLGAERWRMKRHLKDKKEELEGYRRRIRALLRERDFGETGG